jgi:hypothetical protein
MDAEEELPQFTLDATKELGPYFQRIGITPEKARGETLELIVFHWLNDIAETGQREPGKMPPCAGYPSSACSRRWEGLGLN